MDTEILYLGHDNSIDVILKSDSSAVDTSGFTRMTISIGSVALESTNADDGMIRWNKAGYDVGEVRLYLGNSSRLDKGQEQASLVVYNATATNGIVWGEIPLIIKA